jgi:hypothetical protein
MSAPTNLAREPSKRASHRQLGCNAVAFVAMEIIAQADGLLLGQVTYEMMQAGWQRPPRLAGHGPT